jgi:hypothetical protein
MRRIGRFLILFALAACWESAAYGQQPPSPEVLRQLEQIERSFLYFPRKYGEATVANFVERGGVRIDYKTEQGAQAAWWVPQRKGASPERVWIFCGGNGSLALDFEPFVRACPSRRTPTCWSITPATASAKVRPAPQLSAKT